MILRPKSVVTLNVLYYRPDYRNLIQEFVWSLDDVVPELHRTHLFLRHWQQHIDAVIKEVLVGVDGDNPQRIRSVDHMLKLH
jgi:uncharacterized protein Usg